MNESSNNQFSHANLFVGWRNNIDSEIAFYSELIEIDPTNKKILMESLAARGYAYKLKADYEAAIVDFTRVLKMNEKDGSVFVQRASCYFQINEYLDCYIDMTEANKLPLGTISLDVLKHLHTQVKGDYPNYYETLNVTEESSLEIISIAFMNRSLLYDLQIQEATTAAEKRRLSTKFKVVQKAYSVLSNETRRKSYNIGLHPERNSGKFGQLWKGVRKFASLKSCLIVGSVALGVLHPPLFIIPLIPLCVMQ